MLTRPSVGAQRQYVRALLLVCTFSIPFCSERLPEQQQTVMQIPEQVPIESKSELLPWLDSLERRYETACVEIGLANWNSYSGEAPYDLDAAKRGLGAIFLDSANRATIEEWSSKSDRLADKALARRLEIWRRAFVGGAIYTDPDIAARENSLQEQIVKFSLTLDGDPVTRAKASTMLRHEKNQRHRRSLWAVPSQISAATVHDLVQLVKLRNEKARALGYPNYYSLSLALNAINEAWLLETLDTLEAQTRSAFASIIDTLAHRARVKEFHPWDFEYALNQITPLPDKYFPADSVFEVIHRFERGIGFDVDSLPITEYVKDIPYGGLSLGIQIPTDSRFLVNPTKGKGFYGVAFHEYGHSLKAVHTNVPYPILRGYEWVPGAQCAAYEEGVADMHGEFTDDTLWLRTFTAAKPERIAQFAATRQLPALYRLRRLLKDFAIEYEMYRDPDQNLDDVERIMFEKYLLVKLDEKEPHQFASSIWYTAYPCYYQNYILAAMIATQLQEALTSKFGEDGKLSNPAVAQWMIEHLYRSGEESEWTERIRNATGKSLEPGPYLRKLGVQPHHIMTIEEAEARRDSSIQ
jgi:peptidyl-dipeptidase A